MKNYVNFDRVVTAIANGDDIEIDGKTISFFDVDVVVKGFATIYCNIVDMFADDRTEIIDTHEFRVARIIRLLTQTISEQTAHEYIGNYGHDRYLQIVFNLINVGVAPSPALFNIILDTSYGMETEHTLSAGDDAILLLSTRNDDYYKIVNTEFFNEYNAIHNLACADELNGALDLKLPTSLMDWLKKYEWNDIECEYVKNHFDEFAGIFESEVYGNE